LKRQADQAEKTIILHQDEIMAALKSIQGSIIFTTATKSKKMMSDLNFSPDFVKSFISELLPSDRSMSLFDVNVMSKIKQEICFVVVMLSNSLNFYLPKNNRCYENYVYLSNISIRSLSVTKKILYEPQKLRSI
jgi:hypothetical protein